jgi:hypothetical protein
MPFASAQFCPVTFPARGPVRGSFEERDRSMDCLPERKAGVARDPARWQRSHPISGLIGSDAGVTPMWGRACLPTDLTGWLKVTTFSIDNKMTSQSWHEPPRFRVRYREESGHRELEASRRLMTQSGHRAVQRSGDVRIATILFVRRLVTLT